MSGQTGLLTPKSCEECGSDPVFHRLTRWSLWIEHLLSFVALPGAWVTGLFPSRGQHVGHTILPHIFTLLAKVGLGKMTYEVDAYDFKFVTHVLWQEAGRRGIRMYQFRPFNIPKHLFIAEHKGSTLVFDRMPIPRGRGRGVSWIDNKAVLKKKLMQHGLPAARGEARVTEFGARRLFHILRKPVIVKPHQGSGTRHTTLHITTEDELIRAFRIAKRISPWVMIEEELRGNVFRPTLIDGKLVATIERMPPVIVGDGTHTVQELIAKENMHPQRKGSVFSPITINPHLLSELERQGLTVDSVPSLGTCVELHQKINWSVGGTTRDVTQSVHPENAILFEQVAQLLDAPIVGIDFIIEDISRSWRQQDMCGVIETNSMPFIDTHHFPFEGKPQDVASAIWDMAFPETKTNAN